MMTNEQEALARIGMQHHRAIEIMVEALTQRSIGLPGIVAEAISWSILQRLAANDPPILLAYFDELKD